MMRAFLASVIILSGIPAMAGVKIFLYPRYQTGDKMVSVSEIAWVEGDGDDAVKIRRTEIPEKIFHDGFIDRRELTAVLRASGSGDYIIVGNAVRIMPPDTHDEDLAKMTAHAVKKGDAVKLIVKSGKISIETHGVATTDGLPGDLIQVELELVKNKKKCVKGVVREEHLVESRI
jgi:hypothetical protein